MDLFITCMEVAHVNNEKLLQYSMSLSLLSQLQKGKQITDKEYHEIKEKLMKEYNILSDLTVMTA